MTELSFFVIDDCDAKTLENAGARGLDSVYRQEEADPIPTFEYPGDAEIPAQMEKIIVLMLDQLGEAFARMIIERYKEGVKLTPFTDPIRIYPVTAGVDCYNVTKGKGKRGARKMAGKLGGERW